MKQNTGIEIVCVKHCPGVRNGALRVINAIQKTKIHEIDDMALLSFLNSPYD